MESLNLKAHAVAPARHTPPSPTTNPPKQLVLRDGALTVYRRSRCQHHEIRFDPGVNGLEKRKERAGSIA